jgi:inosine/xanthosine triphosphate pyrophosphatase family protein
MQLLIATRNRHKLKELTPLLKDLQLEVISVKDVPKLSEIVEAGATSLATT